MSGPILKRLCANCPFRADAAAIRLEPGRVEGIVADLLADDWSSFDCHKTVHDARTGGNWEEDGRYTRSGLESPCAGAMGVLWRMGQPSVQMRLALLAGHVTIEDLDRLADEVRLDVPGLRA